MRHALPPLALAITFSVASPAAAADPDPFEEHVRLVAGRKWLNPPDWAPAHDQPELAIEGTFGTRRLSAAVDVYASRALSPTDWNGAPVDASGSTIEFCLGFRRIYGRSWFRPYTGIGVEVVRSSFKTIAESRSSSAFGYWFSGGIAFRLWHRVDLGWAFRYSRALAPAGATTIDTGGVHIGVTVGVVFGD